MARSSNVLTIGGIARMGRGVVQSFTYDFAPGEYGWVCVLPGPDGKPHSCTG